MTIILCLVKIVTAISALFIKPCIHLHLSKYSYLTKSPLKLLHQKFVELYLDKPKFHLHVV